MKITPRDKRALILLGVAALLTAIFLLYYPGSSVPALVSGTKPMTIPEAEQLLVRMRQSVVRVPGKDQVLKQANAELATREKGLIQAETPDQAQEQVLQIVKKIASSQSPAIDIRSAEMSPPRPFGDAYGEVAVTTTFECRIEQLVQMLADLSARPELVSTSDLRMTAANAKQKTINVRIRISGLVPRKLVPQRRISAL